MKKTVLFLCTHNSARSQMAEGLLRLLYGNRYEAFSAGVEPTHVHPAAIQVMNEIGVDMSNHRSKSIEEFQEKTFDYVVTVCSHAKETCPFFPGKQVLHQGFDDPAAFASSSDETIQKFRNIRDEIHEWIKQTFQ